VRRGFRRTRTVEPQMDAAGPKAVRQPNGVATPILEITKLEVSYLHGNTRSVAVRGVDLQVPSGGAVALVGESGSGKTTVALSAMRLIKPPIGRIESGSIRFNGTELLDLDPKDMRRVLHEDIGYIPQDPTSALDPLCTVGKHVDETLTTRVPRTQRRQEIANLLESLGVVKAAERLGNYPHEFSGGMNQRVVIASALAREPKLLIADEPTTALDVTTQLGILRLIDQRRRERNLALLFVTHDLSVAHRVCQHVVVMYAGQIVEKGPIDVVMKSPRHPYTRALVAAVPRAMAARSRMRAIPGQPPTPSEVATGCPFAPRCPLVQSKCRDLNPTLERYGMVDVACWYADSEVIT
jgi:oligopeptide/dipeptide ABC transporter ATP-binding protein